MKKNGKLAVDDDVSFRFTSQTAIILTSQTAIILTNQTTTGTRFLLSGPIFVFFLQFTTLICLKTRGGMHDVFCGGLDRDRRAAEPTTHKNKNNTNANSTYRANCDPSTPATRNTANRLRAPNVQGITTPAIQIYEPKLSEARGVCNSSVYKKAPHNKKKNVSVYDGSLRCRGCNEDH